MLNQFLKKRFVPLLLCGCFLLIASSAFAHRLNIFAWVEDDNIIVECNLGKTHPARNAEVAVLDSVTDRELLQGKTNAKGQFVFKTPEVVREGHGLLIRVNAGQGHQNEWKMEASEIYSAASLTAGFEEAEAASKALRQSGDTAVQTNPQLPLQTPANVPLPADAAQPQITQDHVRAIVEDSLQKHLGPIQRQIASQGANGPSLSEIIGGIGWIVGIIGIILYFRSKKS